MALHCRSTPILLSLESSRTVAIMALVGDTIGQRICTAYKAAGLNRRQFSIKTGLDYASISKWEKGTVTPDLLSIRRAVAVLPGVTVGDILGEEASATGDTRLEREDARHPEIDAWAEQRADVDAKIVERLHENMRAWQGALTPDVIAFLYEKAELAALKAKPTPAIPEGMRKVEKKKR